MGFEFEAETGKYLDEVWVDFDSLHGVGQRLAIVLRHELRGRAIAIIFSTWIQRCQHNRFDKEV